MKGPPDAHLTEVEVAVFSITSFNSLIATPRLGIEVKGERSLTTLAAVFEQVRAIALPTGVFDLLRCH